MVNKLLAFLLFAFGTIKKKPTTEQTFHLKPGLPGLQNRSTYLL
jgi:hypothetical protein